MTDEVGGEFGPLLKNAREKRGMSLQQVAASTKISSRVLDALERNDPSKLPGGIFSRAFVRAYAREVGLDPEETVRQFVAVFPQDVEDTTPALPFRTVDAEGFESSRRAAVTLFQIAGLSILIVIVWLIYVNLRPAPRVPTPPEHSTISTPASLPLASSTPASPALASPALASPALASPALASPAPASPALASPAPASPAPAAPMPDATTAATPAATPTGIPSSVPPIPPTTARAAVIPSATPSTNAGPETSSASAAEAVLAVSILAREACWLSLSVDGAKVVARVLQPGERVAYRARTHMILSAGNAGALALTINGKPGKPLGRSGEVVTRTMTVASMNDFFQ